MSYYDNDSSPMLSIFIFLGVCFLCFLFVQCQNSLVDKDLAKVSPSAKSDYLAHNTESWGDKFVGGDHMKKAVFATYQGIAKENNISVYQAVKQTRGKFAGQFKAQFRSMGAFLSLPNVRNAYHSEQDGKLVVIVHYTWQSCSGSGDNHHCWTEHDEVIIPELIQPEPENDKWESENEPESEPEEGNVGIDYEGFDMQVNHEPTVGIDYENFDIILN